MDDIVFPEGNEVDFQTMAAKLGSKLLCCYPESKVPQAVEGHQVAVLVKAVPTKRKQGVLSVYKATGNDRPIFERGGVDIVTGLELLEGKDGMFQRYSGFYHIMAGLAAKRNITIAFSLADLNGKSTGMQAKILGRMAQNARLCRKYKVNMMVVSGARVPWGLRGESDLESFLRELLVK